MSSLVSSPTTPEPPGIGSSHYFAGPRAAGYLLAITSAAVAFLLRLGLDKWLGDQSPYLIFVVAVAVTGLFANVRAAFVALALGGIIAYFCFVQPRYHWGFAGISDVVSFGVYLLASIGVVLLTRSRNKAIERTQRSLENQFEAEKKLIDAETLFRNFLDNSAARTFLRDEDGNYVYANEAAMKHLTIAGTQQGATVPLRFREQDKLVLNSLEARQFTDKIKGPDGERLWLTNKFPFIDQSGRKFVGGVSIDITDRVRAEDIVMKTHRFAAAGQMASLLAHEVNNPLAALTNVIYLLGTYPLDDSAKQLLEEANRALARITRITAKTLSFYAEKDAAESLSLVTLIDEVADVIGSMETFRHIRIIRDLEEGTIIASAVRVRQLIESLLTNAMESGARTVRVRARNATNFSTSNRPGVRITVADDGHGIPRELIASLFDPFVTTKGERGTGLGLWVCNAIVLRAGGTIRVRSKAEGTKTGTCVRVFLPAMS